MDVVWPVGVVASSSVPAATAWIWNSSPLGFSVLASSTISPGTKAVAFAAVVSVSVAVLMDVTGSVPGIAALT